MATIKITITTPRPIDVEVTERIEKPEMTDKTLTQMLRELVELETELEDLASNTAEGKALATTEQFKENHA